jgi:hypothetical protein
VSSPKEKSEKKIQITKKANYLPEKPVRSNRGCSSALAGPSGTTGLFFIFGYYICHNKNGIRELLS